MNKETELKFNEKIITKMKGEYSIRFKKRQKREFIKYAKAEFEKMGYRTQVQDKKINKYIILNQNLIVGDIKEAKTVMCAHYDTPFRSLDKIKIVHGENKSILDKIKSGKFTIMKCLLLTFLLILLNMPLLIVYIIVLSFWMGVPNKQNLNDNTSGVLTIFKIAEELKELNSAKVAFVLFDNEEWGMKGSESFRTKNKDIDDKLFINFDCVGVGDNIVVIGDNESIHEAEQIAGKKEKIEGKYVLVDKMDLSKAKSDERTFKRRIRFAAFHRNEKGQLYVDNIHTKKDNDLDMNNINLISLIIKDYVSTIG